MAFIVRSTYKSPVFLIITHNNNHMAVLDNELLADAEYDAAVIAHTQSLLSQEMKEKFNEELLYYFHDVLEDYLADSDILEGEPDEEGYVNVDLEEIASHLLRQAKKDKMGEFTADELLLLAEAELSYGDDFEE